MKKGETGTVFHGVDMAEDFFSGFVFNTIYNADEFFKASAENGIAKIFSSFANVLDCIFHGQFTMAETFNLWENVPHPVGFFMAIFKFGFCSFVLAKFAENDVILCI